MKTGFFCVIINLVIKNLVQVKKIEEFSLIINSLFIFSLNDHKFIYGNRE